MKCIHTSDWHIGQDFYHYSRFDEHRFFFDQLVALVAREQPDVLLVSGDIYHTSAPSAEAVELYTETMVRLHQAAANMHIVVTAGNHDSPSKLDSTRLVWQLVGNTTVGCRHEDDLSQHIVCLPHVGYIAAVPFFYARKDEGTAFHRAITEAIAQRNTDNLPVLLMAHTYIQGADLTGHDSSLVGGLEADAATDFGTDFDYLAAGHIHRPQTIGQPVSDEFTPESVYPSGTIRYAGSPLHVSFSEDYPHTVSIVEIEAHGAPVHLRREPVRQLRHLRVLGKETPLPLDEALQLLEQFTPQEETYVSLHVLIDRYLDQSARPRVDAILNNRPAIRFCDFVLTRHINPAATVATFNTREIQQLRQSPLQLAETYYREQHAGAELPDSLRQLFNEILTQL